MTESAIYPPAPPPPPPAKPKNVGGRPPKPHDQKTAPRSIRLTAARWEKLKRLGVETWLCTMLDNTPDPKPEAQPSGRADQAEPAESTTIA